MKELKSSVGLGGKPGEGGEEVRQDDEADEKSADAVDGDVNDEDGDKEEEDGAIEI